MSNVIFYKLGLLKYNLHTGKFIQVYSSMSFDKYAQSRNHHQDQDLENFHHRQKVPLDPFLFNPFPLPQTLIQFFSL